MIKPNFIKVTCLVAQNFIHDLFHDGGALFLIFSLILKIVYHVPIVNNNGYKNSSIKVFKLTGNKDI